MMVRDCNAASEGAVVGSTRGSAPNLPESETALARPSTEIVPAVGTELETRVRKSTGLSVAQLIALECLAAGKSATAAARYAKVNAGTIYRWMKEDQAFITQYDSLKRDQLNAARSRLVMLTEQAVDAVAEAVQRGDGRLALELLREMKLTPRSMDQPGDQAASKTTADTLVVQQCVSVTTQTSDQSDSIG